MESKKRLEECEKKRKLRSINKRDLILLICMTFLLFGLSLIAWGKKETSFSYSERRVLAKKPEFSIENVEKGKFMKEFESYCVDQFPFRDAFRTLKAVVSLGIFGKKDNNGIYYTQEHLSKIEYPLEENMLEYAGEKFCRIYEKYLKEQGSRCFFSIVPDKNYFLAKENGYPAMDYEYLFSFMKEKVDFAQYLDIVPFLELEDYYRTDTHWRQEKIVDIARFFLDEMQIQEGISKNDVKESVYQKQKSEYPFYGVYYGQSALPVKPDELYYLTNDTLEQCTVTSFDTGKAEKARLYNLENAKGKDAYEIFLEGANALLVIENPKASKEKELLVFRDSFASSLVPLLAEGYSKITVIDLRYVQSAMLGNLVDFHGQDTLFLYSTLILNQSMALK